jgi:glucan phosphoethanolaminetransferase (alkaline phosphatase superfamily)
MYSAIAAIASAVLAVILRLSGAVTTWWLLGLIFIAAWSAIWAVARFGIKGDNLQELGEAFFNLGDSIGQTDWGGHHHGHDGGGWGGDGGGHHGGGGDGSS